MRSTRSMVLTFTGSLALAFTVVASAQLPPSSPVRPTLPSAVVERQVGAALPHGTEIRERAKAAKLEHAYASIGEVQGKKITMTPADLSYVKTMQDMERGQVIGVMENELAGDETGLPPGKYNLYVASVVGQWHVYAESEGLIVGEALRVRLEERKTPPRRQPEFHARGWGFSFSFCVYFCNDSATVFVSPQKVAVAVGATTQLTGTATIYGRFWLDGSVTKASPAFAWTTSNPAVATVSSTGVVTGVSPGGVTITASYTEHGWNKSGSSRINVLDPSQKRPPAEPEPSPFRVLSFYW